MKTDAIKNIKVPAFLQKVFPKEDLTDVYEGYNGVGSRSETFDLPSVTDQFWVVYRMQMKLYTKSAIIPTLLVLIIAIPVLMYSGVLDGMVIDSVRSDIGDTGETYMAICLALMPVMLPLLATVLCGTILTQEFKVRTAFINFPMPQSRSTFYMGKFLAAFTVATVVLFFVYAVVICMATCGGYVSVSSYAVGESLVLSLAGLFSLCAITYGLSAFMSRGSTMLSFILLFALFPAIILAIGNGCGADSIVGYTPFFAGNMSVGVLGYYDAPSITLLFSSMDVDLSASVWVSVVIYLIIGLLVLIAGQRRTLRREI